MTYLIGRTILTTIKGLAYIIGGLLFGLLPLLTIVLWKVTKVGAKVTLWTIGTALAIAVLMLKSA